MNISNNIVSGIPSFAERNLGDSQQPKSILTDENAISSNSENANEELKEAFTEFVGQTLFGQLMKSMRSSVGKPAYFHGGRTEEVFQAQLDEIITKDLTESSAKSYAEPMFELFQLNRK